MKILHIINSLHTGGAEKLLIDSLPLYQQYGVNADLLLLDSTETPFLKKLKENFQGYIFVSSVKKIYSPKQIYEIKKIMYSKYDIIHAHLFPTLYWVSILHFFSFSKEKLVFTEHSTNNKRLQNSLLRQIDKFIYKQYQKITAITPQVKTVLVEELKISPQKIDVIYNGVDTRKYKEAQAYNKTDFFDNGSTILLQVSRFQEQKDQKTVIRALKLLPVQYTLLLVGDGELRGDCESLVVELALSKRVKFLGVRMDVPELIKTADIVIQSSHWEGFGLTAVEGMAAGKPVIASNVPGLSNIVSDAGLLFEKGNDYDLAEKILSLENSELYYHTTQKCIERSRSYDIKYMVDYTINLYNSLLQ
jgi:glycosyltransferase involved in cell wall biosynthesis